MATQIQYILGKRKINCFIFFTFVILALLWVGCTNRNDKILLSIKQNGVIMQGYASLDSLFLDTVSSYDLSGYLIRKEKYMYGKKEGLSVSFDRKGRVVMTTTYTSNFKNGFNSYFDSSGNCYYSSFYYFDLPVGPIVYRDSIGEAKRYFFLSLQNETLMDIKYKEWVGIEKVYNQCINFNSQVEVVDSTKNILLILYLLSPPRMRFNYSIVKGGIYDSAKYTKVMDIKNDFPFKKINLPLPPDGQQYMVELDACDSILMKRLIIYKDIDQ